MNGQQLKQVVPAPATGKRKATPAMLKQRQQIFVVSLGIWLAMAAWTLSIFFDHIEGLQSSHPNFQKLGASAGELIVLAFIFWHAFHPKIGVRKLALICAFLGGAVVMIHSGAVQGLKAAEVKQAEAESRFTENAGKLVGDSGKGAANAVKGAGGGNRSVTNAVTRATNAGQTDALNKLQEMTAKGQKDVQESTLLPADYIRYWMYSGLFIINSLLLAVVLWKMLSEEDDYDADFDNIPDSLQSPNA